MRIGLVGLGRMGSAMAARLIAGGHEVVGHDVDEDNLAEAAAHGVETATTLPGLVEALDSPAVVWVMVPHGEPTDATVGELLSSLRPGDTVIDGGNSHFEGSIEHARAAEPRGIHFLDAGVSGGVWGREMGYCVMVGGERSAFDRIEPILETLAPEGGYAHVGPSGAGHFVKMVHNGIEYAMLQALGEGFECLRASDFDLDLEGVAALWNRGSVVRSWLLELLQRALSEEGPELAEIGAWVDDSGTGRWTVDFALDAAVPVPTLATALFQRFDSRIQDRYAYRTIAALRKQFGGHAVRGGDGVGS